MILQIFSYKYQSIVYSIEKITEKISIVYFTRIFGTQSSDS